MGQLLSFATNAFSITWTSTKVELNLVSLGKQMQKKGSDNGEKTLSSLLYNIVSKNIQHYVAGKIGPVVVALERIILTFSSTL